MPLPVPVFLKENPAIMHKITLVSLLVLYFPFFSNAQNVSISDDNSTPSAAYLLELRRTDHAQLRIASKDHTDTTTLIFSNRIGGEPSNGGTDMVLTAIRENGLFFKSQSDLLSNNASNILVLRPNGGVGMGTATPSPSSILDLSSTTKGFLPPRMTTAQRSAITSPAAGLTVFDQTTGSLWVRGNVGWTELGGTSSSLWQPAGSDIYYTSGMVGIGINPPDYPLHVSNSTALRSGYFTNTYNGSSAKYGLFANASADGTGIRYGVWGESAESAGGAFGATGVFGKVAAGSGSGPLNGVFGQVVGNSNANQYGVYGSIDPANGGTGAKYGVYGSATGSGAFGVFGINTSTAGFAGFFDGNAKVTNDFTLGEGVVTFDQNGYQSAMLVEFEDNAGNETVEIRTKDVSGQVGGEINLYSDNGTTRTVEIDGNWGGTGKGRIVTGELQITGGADFAEHFSLITNELVPKPGWLVSIVEDGSGRLCPSQTAYDRRVAGIISGAGGIAPGMVMGQAGSIADGEYPVALSGRVYVWADAAFGKIAPGDLLTSSATPGHAMRASDPQLALGAVIGKAMTPLQSGTGLVLVLVNLQ